MKLRKLITEDKDNNNKPITLEDILEEFLKTTLSVYMPGEIRRETLDGVNKNVLFLRPKGKVNIYEIYILKNNIYVKIYDVIGFSSSIGFVFKLEKLSIIEFIKNLEKIINKVDLLEDTYKDLAESSTL